MDKETHTETKTENHTLMWSVKTEQVVCCNLIEIDFGYAFRKESALWDWCMRMIWEVVEWEKNTPT